jgi:DNA-binding response OmpR family regulator
MKGKRVGPGMSAPRVLVVCADLRQSDLIMNELIDAGLDATPAFTADEALGLLADHRYEAVVLAEDLEDGMVGLLRWMGKRHKGVVVTLPERKGEDADEAVSETAEAGVVARLVATLGADRPERR